MEKKTMLHVAWFTPGSNGRWGLPLLLEGRPGTAKTAIIESAAAGFGLACETVIASLREPSDFLGLPIPNKTGGVSYAPPAWALRIADAVRGVVFLDELNTAPPAVQAALLRVVNDSVVGELRLPPGIRWIAAQNAVEESVGGYDLAPPTANRWGHVAWLSTTAEAFADWLIGHAGEVAKGEALDAAAEEARVESLFPAAFAKASGLVAAFVKRRGELLHKQPKTGDPKASKAWPSPRTWELATRALAGAEVHGLSLMDGEELLACFIGEGAAIEFSAWRTMVDLPDPAAVLDGKATFKHEAARLDRTIALLDSCAALVAPQAAEKRNERAAVLWTLLAALLGDAPDLIVPAARTLVGAKLVGMKEAREALKRVQPILAAAGMTA